MTKWDSFAQGCVLIGCGFKAMKIVRSVGSAIQGDHVTAAGSGRIGFLAFSRSESEPETECRSIHDFGESFEAALWKIILVDQCDSCSIDDAIEVCRRSRDDGSYLTIVVKISGVCGVDYGMEGDSERISELRRLADAVLTIGRSAVNKALPGAIERLVIALVSCQGFGAHHFFHWCDIADLREVLIGDMLVEVRGVPYADSSERMSGRLFEGLLSEVPMEPSRIFLAVGGLPDRFALEQYESIYAALQRATVSVFGVDAEGTVIVHAAYIDDFLKDHIEVVTCVALSR